MTENTHELKPLTKEEAVEATHKRALFHSWGEERYYRTLKQDMRAIIDRIEDNSVLDRMSCADLQDCIDTKIREEEEIESVATCFMCGKVHYEHKDNIIECSCGAKINILLNSQTDPSHDDDKCGWSGLGTCPVCGGEVGRVLP